MSKIGKSKKKAVMNKSEVDKFEKVQGQLQALHEELSALSKKSPHDAVNKFKLTFINQIISEAIDILGQKYDPFKDFAGFDEDNLPSNSDVTFIFNQYLACLEKLRADNIFFNMSEGWVWDIIDSDENVRTSEPRKIKQ
jgi:hypothetical protein